MNEPLFIETMRIEAGAIANLESHLRRMQTTCAEAFNVAPDIEQMHSLVIPADAQKCRIVYGRKIESIEFGGYTPRDIRSLRLVEAPSALDYHLKYADRTRLNELVAQKGDCDEILIVKDGYITDTSFSNVVFSDGKELFTPSTPLLPGTMRGKLIEQGIIKEALLTPNDIVNFSYVALINAMLPLGNVPQIPVEKIR